MTHVMRWLGAARRAHDVAVDYVAQREAFGARLGDLGMIQQMVADNEIDIAATRALLLRACWELDQGSKAGNSTSIAKTFAAEAIGRIVDRSVQMCGGLGVSEDLPTRPPFARGPPVPRLRRPLRGAPLGHRETGGRCRPAPRRREGEHRCLSTTPPRNCVVSIYPR